MHDLGVEVLYERLQILDPNYAATISEHDRHKLFGLSRSLHFRKRVSDFSKPTAVEEQIMTFAAGLSIIRVKSSTLASRFDAKRWSERFFGWGQNLEKRGLRENTSASQAIGYRQL